MFPRPNYLLSTSTHRVKVLPLLVTASMGVSAICFAQETQAPKAIGSLTSKVGMESNDMAARSDREKLASQVMSQGNTASSINQAIDQELFNESVKRLRGAEASDPARALAEYRKFLVGRQISPAVGVQVALKVAQLRQQLKDWGGVLLTCDVFSKKFASTPTSVLLQLEKARALQGQKQPTQASVCVSGVMPQLLALGPSYYPQVSDSIIQLAKVNVGGGQEGQRSAQSLYGNVEQIYFEWLKGGMIPHTWQLFESLRTNYQLIGSEQQANDLLPKVASVLVQMGASRTNPEAADASVMAARWLLSHGDTQSAQVLYAKAPDYGNTFVSQVALTDQGQELLANGQPQVALDLMLKNSPNGLEFGPQWVVAQAYWQLEDWSHAEDALTKIQGMDIHGGGADELRDAAQARLSTLLQWKRKSFDLPLCNLLSRADDKGIYHATLYVHSFIPQNIDIQFKDFNVHLNALTQLRQQRIDSGLLVTVYDLSFSLSSFDDVVTAAVTVKDQSGVTQTIQIRKS